MYTYIYIESNMKIYTTIRELINVRTFECDISFHCWIPSRIDYKYNSLRYMRTRLATTSDNYSYYTYFFYIFI